MSGLQQSQLSWERSLDLHPHLLLVVRVVQLTALVATIIMFETRTLCDNLTQVIRIVNRPQFAINDERGLGFPFALHTLVALVRLLHALVLSAHYVRQIRVIN